VDAWGDIRLKARECHRRALNESKRNRRRDAIVAAALKLEDLQLEHYQPGAMVSRDVRGFLDRGSLMVYVARGQSEEDEAIVIAHELGHFKLHRDPRNEVTAIAPALGGDSIDPGAGRVQGYSSRERKEVQADVFAGEFLCPSDWLRDQLLAEKRPADIAKDLELPHGLVMNQAIRALLLPPLQEPAAAQQTQAYELDESQLEAATWKDGPLLVDAGPGTGKTRTLVYRIQRLLEAGVSPASILALTFSNKAAEEMRERLSAENADAAIEMWVGTFHQFGLELITRYPDRVGRTDKVRTLDEARQLGILEDNLTRLPLRYFQNLYEPAYELVPVLRAISDAKTSSSLPQPIARKRRRRSPRLRVMTSGRSPGKRWKSRPSTKFMRKNCASLPGIDLGSTCDRGRGAGAHHRGCVPRAHPQISPVCGRVRRARWPRAVRRRHRTRHGPRDRITPGAVRAATRASLF